MCTNVADSGPAVNQCMRFCATDADCTGAGSYCYYTVDDGAGGAVPGVRLCSRSCNLVTNAGCSAAASCRFYRDTTGRGFTDCTAPVGPGTLWDPCTGDADCASGYACADAGFGPECLETCRVGGGDCLFGETCYGFTTPRMVGAQEYGVCDF